MTVRGKLQNMCVTNGMFESAAKEVIDLSVIEIDKDKSYKTEWDSPFGIYSNILSPNV